MEKNLYIDASHPDETRIVLKSENHIEEYEYENKNRLYLKNNIYLGKVTRIEPSLQAAFVDYGRQRHGFLAFNDIQSDYYQIPSDDKTKLKKEEENLRLELKEKNKDVDDNEKKEQETTDLAPANNNTNENNLSNESNEKSSGGNLQPEKSDQFNELKRRYGIRRYRIQEVIKMGRSTRLLVAILLVGLLAIPAFANSGGPPYLNSEEDGTQTVKYGCTCHGNEAPGDRAVVMISGVPVMYEPDTAYEMVVTVADSVTLADADGNTKAGFLIVF